MNRYQARQIAENISNEDLLTMFKNAKENITDWKQVSVVNKGLSKGIAWNILAKNFDINHDYHILAKVNMIREFGKYLSDELKPEKKLKKIYQSHIKNLILVIIRKFKWDQII